MPRGNVKNLLNNADLTPEQRKKNASKAGKASVEVKRKKKTLRETMEAALQCKYEGELTAMQAGVNATIKKWIETGDVSVLNGIRDLIGEKPVDKAQISTPKDEDFIIEVVKREDD